MTGAPLLDVRALSVAATRSSGPPMPILADVSFSLVAGDTLGIVGESGSGKSTLALALIGLLPDGMRARGTIAFEGIDLLTRSESDLCRIRGARIGMIFQEPLTALNPAMTVGRQIAEAAALHRDLDRRSARREALALLDRVRIPEAARRFDSYPHELSGGQRQRIGIAMALAPGPDLLVADEPTTALDVTVQAEVLDLLAELVAERAMALILIGHDLGVVACSTNRMLVLYAGTRFEAGPTRDVLLHPRNPYTRGLIGALPRPRQGTERLATIPGTVPSTAQAFTGCRFAPRCVEHRTPCDAGEPAWRSFGDGRGVRCVLAPEDAA